MPILWDGGVDLIAAERVRQLEKKGWTREHDDTHDQGELAEAAACYALPVARGSIAWPWGDGSYKPTSDDRIGELAKAGALIAAEIDRLLRVEARSETVTGSP